MRSSDGPYLVLITSTETRGGHVKKMLEEKKEKKEKEKKTLEKQ